MKKIKFKMNNRKNSVILRVSPSFKELVEEVRKEIAHQLRINTLKIPTTLITEKISTDYINLKNKRKRKRNSNLNDKLGNFLDELAGIK